MVLETAARKRRAFNSHTKAEFWLSCHKYALSTYYVPDTRVSTRYTAAGKTDSVPQRTSILKRKVSITHIAYRYVVIFLRILWKHSKHIPLLKITGGRGWKAGGF